MVYPWPVEGGGINCATEDAVGFCSQHSRQLAVGVAARNRNLLGALTAPSTSDDGGGLEVGGKRREGNKGGSQVPGMNK